MDKPVFGEKEQSAEYLNRYAAYIIVEKNNEIALIEAPNGAFFLPGGEIEGQETKKEALRRELIEEMGIAAEIDIYLGEADEYFYSNYRKTHYYNPVDAIQKLKRGSHKWAVEQWLTKKK